MVFWTQKMLKSYCAQKKLSSIILYLTVTRDLRLHYIVARSKYSPFGSLRSRFMFQMQQKLCGGFVPFYQLLKKFQLGITVANV